MHGAEKALQTAIPRLMQSGDFLFYVSAISVKQINSCFVGSGYEYVECVIPNLIV